MGNALRYLYKNCCQPSTTESGQLGPHGISAQTVGVSALARDLLHFEATSQVPDELSKHVVSSKKAQANWYKKLIPAWKEAKPPPRTPEDAARLIVHTLKNHQKADVEGLLAFYGLPHPQTLVETSTGVPSSLPDGVKYELHTLPVDVKAVADGDTVTVYVSTKDPRESSSVPREVQVAAVERAKARAVRDYVKADALHKKIIDQNYRVINVHDEEVLARKYRIRLRGIDAPESAMPHGQQAKEALANLLQGKCLQVLVYGDDRYGRCVGDIYCNGIFAQVIFSSAYIYHKVHSSAAGVDLLKGPFDPTACWIILGCSILSILNTSDRDESGLHLFLVCYYYVIFGKIDFVGFTQAHGKCPSTLFGYNCAPSLLEDFQSSPLNCVCLINSRVCSFSLPGNDAQERTCMALRSL